jgi:hypothetical protein
MSYDVIVKIIADGAKAKAEFDRTGKAAERMAKKTDDEVKKAKISMEKFGRQAGIAGAAMIGAAGTVAFAMKGWVKSAQEAEMASMRLESSVRGAYGSSSNAVKAFEAQAKAIQRVTVASDEDVMSIQALLTQFGLTQRQVTTLTPLVVDISRKWGIDYVGAAKAVAKAADGKATALKKLGINVDETKAKTDPYIATVEALRRAAGGFAQQEGKTFAGQTAILSNQMDELKESLGRGVLQVLNDVLPAVNGVAGAFTGLNDTTGGFIGSISAVGTGLAFAVGTIGVATSAVIKLKTAYEEADKSSRLFAISTNAIKFAGVIAGIAAIAVAGDALFKTLDKGIFKFGEKADEALGRAINAESGRRAAREFFDSVDNEFKRASSSATGFNIQFLDLFGVTENDRWADAFEKQFKKLAAASPEVAGQFLDLAQNTQEWKKKLDGAGISIAELRKRIGDTADTNKDGKVTFEEVTVAMEKQAQAADDLINLTDGRIQAERSYAQAVLGVAEAQQAVSDAQTAYNEALKSGDPAKIREAQLSLQGALLSLADAQDAARDAAYKHGEMLIALEDTANDPEAYNEAIAKLERMKALLTDPAEKQAIQDKINMLTWFRAMAQAPIDTSKIVGPLGAINGQLERIKANLSDSVWSSFGNVESSIVNAVVAAVIAGRASGGPVSAGTPYVVGENGPELFVPDGNGQIVPNSRLNSVAMTPSVAYSSSGASIVVNVSSSALSTPAETGAAVVDALTAWSRRNGKLPNALVA